MSNKSFIRDAAVKVAVKLGVYTKIVSRLNRRIAKREAAAIRKHGVEVLAKVDEVGSERPANMLDYMRENGFRLVRQFYIKEDGWISVEQFEYNGVPVDFYYFFEKDEDTVAVIVPFKHEYKDWKEANDTDGFPSQIITAEKTAFSRQDFMGIQFYMPDKAASWLAGFYGDDFMTPVKNWAIDKRETTRRPYPVRQYRNLEIVEQQSKL